MAYILLNFVSIHMKNPVQQGKESTHVYTSYQDLPYEAQLSPPIPYCTTFLLDKDVFIWYSSTDIVEFDIGLN